MRNLYCRFVLWSNGQIYGGDFAKFCGLLRIYELYHIWVIIIMPLSSFNEVSKFGKKKKNLIFFEQAVLRRPRKKIQREMNSCLFLLHT